jgi:MYXO-CTERM domain-containing protein
MNMIRPQISSFCGLGAAILFLAPPASADTASDAFEAWNDAFLVQENDETYYATTITTYAKNRQGTWVGALDIAVAEDAFERTHSDAHRQLVHDLVTTFIKHETQDWSFDSWNDDIAWMVIAVLRGYQITGDETFLDTAIFNWNMAFDRGWDTTYGGGGVWEEMNRSVPGHPEFPSGWGEPSKCNLSNNPMINMGAILYEMTGEQAYLDKIHMMYDWVRQKLFNTETGSVYDCIGFKTQDDYPGYLQNGDNAFNSGNFIEAANAMYRVTGEQMYLDDALLALNYRRSKEPIMANNGQGERQWGYRVTKGVSEIASLNELWPEYLAWTQSNAEAAWSQRNTLDLTWNDWKVQTPLPQPGEIPHENDVVALSTSSAVAIWQHLPPTDSPTFEGNYELRNVESGLSLVVSDASPGEGAAIVQETFDGAAEALWSFEPSQGGYFWIRNAASELVLDVDVPVARIGAKLIQSGRDGLLPGSDRWFLAKNEDGTYSFYNLNSRMALDNLGASAEPGTGYAQWASNGSNAQKFEVVSHELPVSGTGGSTGSSGGSSGVAGGDSSGSGGGDGELGTGGADDVQVSGEESGCGCRAGGDAPAHGMWMVLLGLGTWLVRRRRTAVSSS